MDKILCDILSNDHPRNSQSGHGLSTRAEVLTTIATEMHVVSSVEELVVKHGITHHRVRLKNDTYTVMSIREAKARGNEVVKSWLKTKKVMIIVGGLSPH